VTWRPDPGRQPEGRPSAGDPSGPPSSGGPPWRGLFDDGGAGSRQDAGPAEPAEGDVVDGEVVEGEVVEGDGAEDRAEDKAGENARAGGKTILTDTAALMAERDEYLTALQLLQADFENFRKRVQRQQQEQAARGAADLVRKLLPVLDTLDLAEAHLAPPGDKPTDEAKALFAARSQLMEALDKEGLERIDRTGVGFDPVVHDAVAHSPAGDGGEGMGGADRARGTNHETRGGEAGGSEETGTEDEVGTAPAGGPTVDEVLRAGYRWHGQVLRPAMVRVKG
jgi:molecular chaperone GrpE